MTNRTVSARARTGLLTAVALASFLMAMTAVPVHAASAVDIQARALMGGRYEIGGWAAVAVTLVNDGEPTQGDLSAETVDGSVRRFVELPAGARKVVMLYVQPEAFQRQITVRYQEPNGTVEASADVRGLEQSGSQVAIVGDGTGAIRGQLAAALDESAPEPLALPPADLPERPEPLQGLTSIVWAADSSTLTEPQRRSLLRWVAGGGALLVVGGADWQARTAAFTDLLPLSPLAASDGVSQSALAAWSGSPEAPVAAATVSSGPLAGDARALVTADDGTVLVSMRSVGAGRVILVGVDVATEAYRTWEGSPPMWARLVPSNASLAQFFGGGFPIKEEAMNAMAQALSNLPSLEVPPAELLLAVVVGYILLIGPISYLVLRRLDRREAAWITAPVLIVLFTACSYGIGSTLKGSDVILNQIALIRTSPAGGTALVETYAGVFSPQRSTYDLRVEADALMAAVRSNAFGGGLPRSSDVTVDQGNPAQLRDLAVGVYGFESVRADAVVEYEPSLQVSWRRDGDDLIGTVTNAGSTPLSDVAYVSNAVGERIGDLAPGQQAEFTVPTRNFNGSAAADQIYGFAGFDPSDATARRTETRRQVINGLVGYGQFMPAGVQLSGGSGLGPYLIGWRAEEGPAPILVEGLSTQRYAQAVEVLAVRHPVGPGEVTLGPEMMSVAVIATEGDASPGGPGMMFIGEGSATYSITLPLEAANMTVTELMVLIGPDPSFVFSEGGGGANFPGMWPPGVTAEIRDPSTGEWRVLGDISEDATFDIDDPATAMSAGGRIEVRVTAPGIDANFGGQSSVFVSAEVSGVIGE